MSHRLRTPRLLVAFGGLSYVLFPIPIITLFWKDQIGLTLTEIMLLGVASLRAGSKLYYDAANMKVTNNAAANEFLTRQYRSGYSL